MLIRRLLLLLFLSPVCFTAACSSSGRSQAQAEASQTGEEIKDSFLFVGGELEEFFTGERTVDR